MQSLLSDSGTVLEAESNQPVFLCDPSVAYVVQEGTIDLFAAEETNGSPSVAVTGGDGSSGLEGSWSGDGSRSATGRRRHLCRCDSGSLLFGTDSPSDVASHVLAIGTMGTRLRRFDRTMLSGLTEEEKHYPQIEEAVDAWIEALSMSLGMYAHSNGCTLLVPDAQGTLSEGERVSVPSGVCWVRHQRGRSHLVGHGDAVLEGDVGFPLTKHTRIEADTDGILETASTLTLLRHGALWDELDRFNTRILHAIEVTGEQRKQRARERFRRQQKNDQSTLQTAYRTLSGILHPDQQSIVELKASDDPLQAALRIVGNAQGIEFQSASAGEDLPKQGDEVKEAARRSGVRARKVLLRNDWWLHDSGPLLAQYKADDTPVALLPSADNGGYTLLDPGAETSREVDVEVNDELAPFAYSFYRPFPERALDGLDVLKHALKGSGRDLVLVLSAAAAVLNMVVPIATGMIFDSVIPEAERTQLLQITLALLAAAGGVALLSVTRNVSLTRLTTKMESVSEAALMDRVLKLPTSFFRQFTAGDLANRMQSMTSIRRLLSGSVATSMLSGSFSLLNVVLLFFYSNQLTGTWTMAWWGIGLLAAAFGVIAIFGMIQLRYEREITRISTALSGHVLQLLTGITKLRVAGAEAKAFQQWSTRFGDQQKLEYGAQRTSALSSAIERGIPTVAMLVIFWQMMSLSRDAAASGQALSTGYFLAFHASFMTSLSGILMMKRAFINVLKAIPKYEIARPILESVPEVQTNRSSPGLLQGKIRMEQVDFRYAPDDGLVLRDVSIRAEPGEFVALVGPSGSGKSTVLRLLLGFESPEAGSIYYDDQSLDQLDVRAVRQQIGVVLQDSNVLPGDLRTNIVGATMASLDDAWRAAEMAGLKEDIQEMPMGMSTMISTGGGTLSGGQKQRLMIARALVSNPSLIYFDEATSALDNKTQSIVSDSLDHLSATRIVIAHRLSTIIEADRIYVLDEGTVVQHGSYDDLVEEDGVFARLVKRQIA